MEEGEGGEAQNDMAEAKLQPTSSGSDDSDDDITVCSHFVFLFMYFMIILTVISMQHKYVISLFVISKAFILKLHEPFCVCRGDEQAWKV